VAPVDTTSMICPFCLREVPELHGPERLCIRCMTILGEDNFPDSFDLFPPSLDTWTDGFPPCEDDFVPEMAWGCVGEELEALEALDGFGDDGVPGGFGDDGILGRDGLPPTFRGSPRF
jgi:hypothetical protein